jgi:uncharacterized membrane protein YagU involved in acid resistance
MVDMDKVKKEADLYKNLETKELKKVIKKYKRLCMSNSHIYNFVFTLICVMIPYVLFWDINLISLSFLLLLHYLIFDKYFFEYKKWKLVSDEDREEMEEIILILEESLKNKKPLE